MRAAHAKSKRCHWGSKFVFAWNGIRFFGGGFFRGLETAGMDVVIDCGANFHPAEKETGPPAPQKVMAIQWPDGGIPDMAGKDWQDILGLLQERKQAGNKAELNVLVCCSGGHGRTGTALAVMAAFTGVEPEDPVVFIRSQYCRKAVETKAQCGYVRAMVHLHAAETTGTLPDSCESDLSWP